MIPDYREENIAGKDSPNFFALGILQIPFHGIDVLQSAALKVT